MKMFRDYLKTIEPTMTVQRGGREFLIYKIDEEDWGRWAGVDLTRDYNDYMDDGTIDYPPTCGDTYATTKDSEEWGYDFDGNYSLKDMSPEWVRITVLEAILDFLNYGLEDARKALEMLEND